MEITKIKENKTLTAEDVIKRSISPHKQNNILEPNPLIECERLACRKTVADKVELSKNKLDEAKPGKIERDLMRGKRLKPRALRELIKSFRMLFM